jgi:tetrahydroxynaphthalene reductase
MGSLSPNPHIPFRLDGKVALVTGAGRGIGAAMAIELGRCGAKVIVNYIKSSASAATVVSTIKSLGSDAVALQADVSSVPQIEALFASAVTAFGGLDIVCSNSGVVSFGHLRDVTEAEFDRVFSVNTRGQFFVAREAYKHLNEHGRIILMSSNTADAFTVPKHSLYSASKGAINTFVRCLAKDCGDKKITVNAVAPGGTVTDMFYATAKDYLPNAENMTEQEILDVSFTDTDHLADGH